MIGQEEKALPGRYFQATKPHYGPPTGRQAKLPQGWHPAAGPMVGKLHAVQAQGAAQPGLAGHLPPASVGDFKLGSSYRSAFPPIITKLRVVID